LSNGNAGDGEKDFRIEGGIPIFKSKLEQIEREQAEAKKRDEQYRDEQGTINRQQLTVNRRLMIFTGCLLVTSILSGSIAIWQAYIVQESANSAMSSAGSAARALRENQRQFELTSKSNKEQFDKTLMQMQKQSRAQWGAVSAAKDSAGAAKRTVSASTAATRAWVIPTDVTVTAANAITVKWVNEGKVPAFNLQMTAEYSVDEFYEFRSSGCDRFLNKPLHWDTFDDVLVPREGTQNDQRHVFEAQLSGFPEQWDPPKPFTANPRKLSVDACLFYKDVFSDSWHSTEFCFSVEGLASSEKAGTPPKTLWFQGRYACNMIWPKTVEEGFRVRNNPNSSIVIR
jgi:hypothetical protein